jgi:hypothetical protein
MRQKAKARTAEAGQIPPLGVSQEAAHDRAKDQNLKEEGKGMDR